MKEGYHKMTQPYRCPDCGLTIEHPGRKCPFCGSRITKLKSRMPLHNKSIEPTETVNKSTIIAFCTGLLSIIFPLLCILPTMGIIASRAGKSRIGLQRHRIYSRNLQHHHAGHRIYILCDHDLTNYISRSRAEVARKAHNLDVAGSSPASATKRCCHTSCRGAANP